MDTIEQGGKNVDEAVKRGLAHMGLTRKDVKIEVLDKGASGVLGFLGSRPARVRITPVGNEELVRETLETLLREMKISFQATVQEREDICFIEVETAGADGLLIGRRGDTLNALQHIMDRMVNRGRTERIRVSIDVGGYRRRRDEGLRQRALLLARQVKTTGRERSTDPLHPPDRRVVHLALTDDPGVRTYTVGEGTYRTVVVAPAEGRESGGTDYRRRGPSSRSGNAQPERAGSGRGHRGS